MSQNEDMKGTDSGVQYKRCGLRNNAKEFCLLMPSRPCPTAGHERAKSRGKTEVIRHMVDKMQGGHMVDKV